MPGPPPPARTGGKGDKDVSLPAPRPASAGQVAEWLRVFVEPGQVTELRILKWQRRPSDRKLTVRGYYDFESLDSMAAAALQHTGAAKGVYFTFNPLDDALHARCCDRVEVAESGESANDKSVPRRRWLMVDVDPVRDPHVSSTDDEKDAAWRVTEGVRDFLAALGWPAPVLDDSGNGYHLIFRVDLPSDDGGLVEGVLAALAARFDCEAAKVDRTVHNPARIIKVPGTLARKGDHVPGRPHRASSLLDVPAELVPVPDELLRALAAEAGAAATKVPASREPGKRQTPRQVQAGAQGGYSSRLDVARWLAARGVGFKVRESSDTKVYDLEACPFDPSHTGTDAGVMQSADGALSAKCFHSSCAGRGWREFKRAIGEPDGDHYDPPLRERRAARPVRESPGPVTPAPDGMAACETLARVLAAAKADPKGAIDLALAPDSLDALVRLEREDPGELQRALRSLEGCGCTVRHLELLRRTITKAARKAARDARAAAEDAGREAGGGGAPLLSNYLVEVVSSGDGKQSSVKVGLDPESIAGRVRELTGGWPKRVGERLFVPGGDAGGPRWLGSTNALFAWLHASVAAEDGRTAVRWGEGEDKASQACFFSHLQGAAESFDAVEAFPHEPLLASHYYMHPRPEGGDGKALRGLLGFFNPSQDEDRDLIEAFFLSLFWGGPAGSRPAWLFTSREDDERGGIGVGKSTVPQVAAELLGGMVELDPDDRMADFKTRLLSPAAMRHRIALLDNLKSLKFSWAQLEGLITNPVVSGHAMYVGEGQRPNVLTYCLTLNGAALSRDMASRCAIVEMARPNYSGNWRATVSAFVTRRRWAIVGDCLARLRSPAEPLPRHGRWGLWEDAVLARVPDPSNCQSVIRERQAAVDEDSAEAGLVRSYFEAAIRLAGYDPDSCKVFVPSAKAAGWVNEATGARREVRKACAFLNALSVQGIKRDKADGQRGFVWTGAGADAASPVTPLGQPLRRQGC